MELLVDVDVLHEIVLDSESSVSAQKRMVLPADTHALRASNAYARIVSPDTLGSRRDARARGEGQTASIVTLAFGAFSLSVSPASELMTHFTPNTYHTSNSAMSFHALTTLLSEEENPSTF